jgi:hypothetical protein
MAERRVTDGGRALRAYLDKIGRNIPDWCDEWNAAQPEGTRRLDRQAVARLVNGERWAQIPVDTALLIQRATHGKVRVEMFRSETAQPVQSAA